MPGEAVREGLPAGAPRYEFSDPAILRAVYRGGDAELLGRDMLLEGRFYGLRFYLGVRVTRVIDETQGTGPASPSRCGAGVARPWKATLARAGLTYEVLKNTASGEVTFRVSGYSRRAPIVNPLIRWGFQLFGRWTRVRFYASVQRRMRRTACRPASAVRRCPNPRHWPTAS